MTAIITMERITVWLVEQVAPPALLTLVHAKRALIPITLSTAKLAPHALIRLAQSTLQLNALILPILVRESFPRSLRH